MQFHLASWPGFAATLALSLLFALTVRSANPTAQRLAAAIGFLALLPLLLLGAIWPSGFTIAALLTLPAGVVLLAAVARPSLLRGYRLRQYSLVAVMLSPTCVLVEVLWLLKWPPF